MTAHTDIPLKIERLSAEEDDLFQVSSPKEIRFILNQIAEKVQRTALYYENANAFLITTVLDVNDEGLLLECLPETTDNDRLLHSPHLVFVSSQNHVKVQFVSEQAELRKHDGKPAFFIRMPKNLLRIQRRDYYRLPTSVNDALTCIIPITRDEITQRHEAVIMDISGGGLAIVCKEQSVELTRGEIYPACRVQLPGNISFTVDIQIRNTYAVTLPDGSQRRRAGCQFINLDGKAAIQLQRYITQQQQKLIRR